VNVLDSARDALDTMILGRHPRLRAAVKRAYCRIRDPLGKGRHVPLAVGISLHMPTYFSTTAWHDYETVAMNACLNWVRSSPNPLLVDVGCSVAIYSLMALQASDSARVIAVDPDRISLKTTTEFCRFADTRRLSLVQGFAADHVDCPLGFSERLDATRKTLGVAGLRSDPTAIRYLSLESTVEGEAIPHFTLDSLLLALPGAHASTLLKIDVEGAELLVLRGAIQILQRDRPSILLSVHPQFLPRFGQSTVDVAEFLRSQNYLWTVLGTDHEEHWWCEADRRTDKRDVCGMGAPAPSPV